MDAIDTMEEMGRIWIEATDAEARADVARVTLRAELTDSLIGSDNPATGKPHSATSAEKAAEAAAEYMAAREAAREATKAARLAYVTFECAKLRARAAVATMGVA